MQQASFDKMKQYVHWLPLNPYANSLGKLLVNQASLLDMSANLAWFFFWLAAA